jgi:hypothetical protein
MIYYVFTKMHFKAFLLSMCFVLAACDGSSGGARNLAEGLIMIALSIAPGGISSADMHSFNYPRDAIEYADGTVYVAETVWHVERWIKNRHVELFASDLHPR